MIPSPDRPDFVKQTVILIEDDENEPPMAPRPWSGSCAAQAAEPGLDKETVAFIEAIGRYWHETQRPWPTWEEVLQVARSLGYRQVVPFDATVLGPWSREEAAEFGLSEEDVVFIKAVERRRTRSGAPPRWAEVWKVLQEIGYRKETTGAESTGR